MTKPKIPTTAAFVSQKGGVGKSALARLLAVGAIHRGRKTLYVSESTARILDPICRAELERMEGDSKEWALVLRHLAEAGPSSSDDLKVELGLKPKELKQILYPLELCGAVLTRPVEPGAKGEVDGFELARWDQVFPERAVGGGGIEELVVAGVRAAVREGAIRRDEIVVCVLTGNGLKDPDTAMRGVTRPLEAQATVGAVMSALGW